MKRKLTDTLVLLIYAFGLSLPLILTAGRILIPDTAFDTINYHTFTGERGWSGQNVSGSEFYPLTRWSFFPLLDMINTLAGDILGYRLGTVTQTIFFYLSMLLIFLIIRLLKLSTGNKLLDAALQVNIFISLEGLFQLASYFTDVISTFLILLFVYVFLLYKKTGKTALLFLSTAIISFAVLCKYTNYIYFVPFIILLIVDTFRNNANKLKAIPVLFAHFLVYIVINGPWMAWNYINTGNPVFPYFNSIFKSEYFLNVSWQFDQGPQSIWESLSYPIFLFFNNTRLGQYHDLIPDYKLSFYIIIVILSYALIKRYRSENLPVWYLYVYFLLTYVCWVFVFGFARYAIAFEFLAGVLLLGIFAQYLKNPSRVGNIIAGVVLALFLWQDVHFLYNNLKYDISWRRNLWNETRMYIHERRNLFNNSYTYPNIDNVDVYVNCGYPNLGYMVPSNLSTLPVLTLNEKSWLSENEFRYQNMEVSRITGERDLRELNFVTVVVEEGLDTNDKACYSVLDSYGAVITDSYETNFLGYERIRLKVLTGHLSVDSIAK